MCLTASADGDDEQPTVELDVREFLDQALHTVHRVDFTLESVRNQRAVSDAGWHRDEHNELVGGEPPEDPDVALSELDDERVEGVVVVRRKGEFRVPVEIEVEFEDGETVRRVWDGQGRYHILSYPGRRVRRATVDPDGVNWLEAITIDNTMYAAKARDDAGNGATKPIADAVELAELALLGGLAL